MLSERTQAVDTVPRGALHHSRQVPGYQALAINRLLNLV